MDVLKLCILTFSNTRHTWKTSFKKFLVFLVPSEAENQNHSKNNYYLIIVIDLMHILCIIIHSKFDSKNAKNEGNYQKLKIFLRWSEKVLTLFWLFQTKKKKQTKLPKSALPLCFENKMIACFTIYHNRIVHNS